MKTDSWFKLTVIISVIQLLVLIALIVVLVKVRQDISVSLTTHFKVNGVKSDWQGPVIDPDFTSGATNEINMSDLSKQ